MSQRFAIVAVLNAARKASPLLWWASVVMFVGLFICLGLQFFDLRLLAGVSVWDKPAKFFLSLIVQALTIAWAISLVNHPLRGVKIATWIFVSALTVELSYMIIRASRGEASHFNIGTTFAGIMYTVMGVGAILLVSTSAFVGWRVWRERGQSLMREAAGLGLMLGALLGAVAGGYLSQQHGHWIGGDMSDAAGLPFFHWSTTGGDLRVAHFVGLHTAQVLPLAALSQSRWVVYGAALICVLLMAATFGMAVMGLPLFSR